MTQSGTGQSSAVKLDPPRFVSGKAMPIAGLKVRFTPEAMNNIAQLWLRFVPHIGHSSGQVGRVAYRHVGEQPIQSIRIRLYGGSGSFEHVGVAPRIQPRDYARAALRGLFAPWPGIKYSRPDRCGAQVVRYVGS